MSTDHNVSQWKPNDRVRWELPNGTVRRGTARQWFPDTGTWLVDIDPHPDAPVGGEGFATWFKESDLILERHTT